MSTGVSRAWTDLKALEPDEVCERTDAAYDASLARYSIRSFGQEIFVSPSEKHLSSPTPLGTYIVTELASYSHLAILEYLLQAKKVSCLGRLVKPNSLPGGQIYSRGTHILPLERLTQRYAHDRGAFVARGRFLGGSELDFGDASMRLQPLPQLPVALILWEPDEEFPARTDFLFYDTCKDQLAPDIMWAIAMMTVALMLSDAS